MARQVIPLAGLRDKGLLWLINRVVFHPRGYAIGVDYRVTLDPATGEKQTVGEPIGWLLLGDGSEVWTMGDDPPEDTYLARVESFLAEQRTLEEGPYESRDWEGGPCGTCDGDVWRWKGHAFYVHEESVRDQQHPATPGWDSDADAPRQGAP